MIERLSTRIAISTIGGALAASALSGCSDYSESSFKGGEAPFEHVVVDTGGNIRLDPSRIDDENDGNSCFIPETSVTLPADYIANTTDGNGEWYGIELNSTTPDIQEACAEDLDGIIWVSSKVAHARKTATDDGAYSTHH